MNILVIYKRIEIKPTRAQLGVPTAAEFDHVAKVFGEHDNPNVLNILPVTTLRTIDLAGKKNPGPLFSIF